MADRVLLRMDGDVAVVSLNRPDKHNGMDFEMLAAVLAMQRRLRGMRGVRGVLLRGEGPSFCAGLDFKSAMGRPAQMALGVASLLSPWRNRFQRWSMGWRDLPVPVVAIVHGNCFGAGLQLALGADIRVAAPDAALSVMEAKWGLVPDMGGVALLRELVGIDTAKELTFSGRVLSAGQAHELGLLTHVAADPQGHAQALMAEFLARSPDSVAAGKRLLQSAWLRGEGGALQAERWWQWRVIGGANQRVAVRRNLGGRQEGRDPEPFGPRRVG